MRIVRYVDGQRSPRWGALRGDRIQPLRASPLEGEVLHDDPEVALDGVRLLAPTRPTKIIGVGRNYPAHAAEHGAAVPERPLIFLKPPSAVAGPGDPIRLPPLSAQVEHEGELAVVIGRPGRDIAAADAPEHVAGYTAANDVTARDLQRSDPQWTRGKGFDTFCPLGPWIETALDLAEARITCTVNGELRQQGRPADMVFDVPQLIAFISQVMYTLRTALGEGHYRVNVNFTSEAFSDPDDTSLERREALLLSFDQALSDIFGAWIRLGFGSEKALANYKNLYSGGINITGKWWGREQDNIGVGYAYLKGAEQTEESLDYSHVAEGYVRFGLNDYLALTFDLQYMQDTYVATASDNDVDGWIAGVRMTAEF